MSLGFHYNGDGTVTVTCGDQSVTIGAPQTAGPVILPPVSTGGDGTIVSFRNREVYRIPLDPADDAAELLLRLEPEPMAGILFEIRNGVPTTIDLGDLLGTAQDRFGADVMLGFSQGEDNG